MCCKEYKNVLRYLWRYIILTVIAEMVQISLMTQGKSWLISNDILLYQQSQQLVIIHFFQKIPLQNQDERNEILSLHNRFIKQKLHSCDSLSTSINYLLHNIFCCCCHVTALISFWMDNVLDEKVLSFLCNDSYSKPLQQRLFSSFRWFMQHIQHNNWRK